MSELIRRKFMCTGCGENRPCYLETNQGKDEIAFYDSAEYLKCALDKTNQTVCNWKEVEANEQPQSDSKLQIHSVVCCESFAELAQKINWYEIDKEEICVMPNLDNIRFNYCPICGKYIRSIQIPKNKLM